MRNRAFRLGHLLLALSVALPACSQQAQSVTLRSLEASGRAAFVCVGEQHSADGRETTYVPRSMEDCPDVEPFSLDHEDRHLLSLVTQTSRGEVAILDLAQGGVVDEEPTVPGYNFLPIGAQPTGIASTPGSVATFVGVAEVGKEGIFAIPTSCISPRKEGERVRDLVTWPACRLPSAPGELAVLIDPASGETGHEAVRQTCDGEYITELPEPDAAKRSECPADLSTETRFPGRRKLAVTLPDRAEIAIVDAQAILDRDPGSYEPCPIERYVRLHVDLPTTLVSELTPPDLTPEDPTAACLPPSVAGEPRESKDYFPQPAGIAFDATDQDHRLFVADAAAPVVHVLDAVDPCNIREEQPLLPLSFVDPKREVTTRKVAVSPLTSKNRRFLYAVDEFDGGSVMVFDVSQGATDRTPIVRPRSAFLPFEAPDRIAFDAPAQDVTFAQRDRPVVDPDTGNQAFGAIECDPDPKARSSSPGVQYRPTPDLSSGAGISTLRGVFGFVALDSGQIAVIDVEDLDAPCRRPVQANHDAGGAANFRGCGPDPAGISEFALSSGPTVTNEESCRVVEPHRARSAVLVRNDPDTGVHAPALRALPKLISEDGRTLLSDLSEEGRRQPRMLGVNFSSNLPADHARVYVGTALYEVGSGENPIVIDPAAAQQNSLVLSFEEPRAYGPQEDYSAMYEGSLVGERPVARFERQQGEARATLIDSGISFCDQGVEDESAALDRARALGVDEGSFEQFQTRHADYIDITGDLLPRDDDYWKGAGAKCGGATQAGAGYIQCRSLLGTAAVPRSTREFRVVEAYSGKLSIEPRAPLTERQKDVVYDLVNCCFPGTVSYKIRASAEWVVRGSATGFRHSIVTDPSTGRCVRSCDPLKSRLEGRAFEVACRGDACPKDANGAPLLGEGNAAETACIVDSLDPSPSLPSPGDASVSTLQRCIFQGLTSRFVIYQGQSPSTKDMQFQWQVRGGFAPWVINLASSDPNASPQSMQFVTALDGLVLTDGSSLGVVFVPFSTFTPTSFL